MFGNPLSRMTQQWVKSNAAKKAKPAIVSSNSSGGGLSDAVAKAGSIVKNAVKSEPLTEQETRIAGRREQLAEDGKLIGGTMNGKKYDDINAEIQRRQWDEFEKNDKPYILNYADDITSGKYTENAINQARTGINTAYQQAEQSQDFRDRSLGVGLSSAQQVDRKADTARSKTASLIDAENNARLAATDRDNALLAGSHMPTVGN